MVEYRTGGGIEVPLFCKGSQIKLFLDPQLHNSSETILNEIAADVQNQIDLSKSNVYFIIKN